MIGKPLDLLKFLYQQDPNKLFELTEWKERRSKDANAYAWVLITKIGNVLRKSKEDIYEQMLRDYSQATVIKIRSDIDPKGFFRHFDKHGERDGFIYLKIYKGSSEMNTLEMSILIDGIVQEAQQLGIETMTPQELAALKEAWR